MLGGEGNVYKGNDAQAKRERIIGSTQIYKNWLYLLQS